MKIEKNPDVSSKENFKWWSHFLKNFIGKPNIFLEIGTYEGKTAVWFLENILTHEASRIVCIDPWTAPGNDYLRTYDMEKVEKKYKENIEPYKDKVFTVKGFSFDVLCALNAGVLIKPPPAFSLVYVDGDHRTSHVLSDCVLAWNLLISGGIMIFDDYGSGDINSTIQEHPKLAIDNFLQTIPGEYEVLFYSYQLMILKK